MQVKNNKARNLVFELTKLRVGNICTGTGVNTSEGFIFSGSCGGVYLFPTKLKGCDTLQFYYDWSGPGSPEGTESWGYGTPLWELTPRQAAAAAEYSQIIENTRSEPKQPDKLFYRGYEIVRLGRDVWEVSKDAALEDLDGKYFQELEDAGKSVADELDNFRVAKDCSSLDGVIKILNREMYQTLNN